MMPIMCYLQENEFPSDEVETKKIQKFVEKYMMIFGRLYKMGNVSPMLRCLGEHEVVLVLREVF